MSRPHLGLIPSLFIISYFMAMISTDPVHILEALYILRNTSGEKLQSYRNKILSVLKELKILMGANTCAVIFRGHGDLFPPPTKTDGSSSVSTDCCNSSSTLLNVDSWTSPSLNIKNSPEDSEPSPALPKSVVDLMRALDDKSSQVMKSGNV